MLTQQRPGVIAAVLAPEDEPAFWCNLTMPPLQRSRAAALDALGGAYVLPSEPQPGLYGGTLDIPPPPAAVGLSVGIDCTALPFVAYTTGTPLGPPIASGLAAGIDCTDTPFVAYAKGDLYPAARDLAAGTDILDSIYLLGA